MISLPIGALAVTSLAMTMLWLVQRRTRNAGIVDVGWAFSVGTVAVLAAALFDGWIGRRIAIATIMAIWSVRLGSYLLRDRVLGRPEDGRYAEMRRGWGASADRELFWFFQVQALAAVFFALPALIASRHGAVGLSPIEQAGLLLWVVAFAGELTADAQLEQFKRDPANRGRTCRAGLWRYSRHPNYFFEWLMWMAYAVFTLASPFGWLALACPLAMLYFLFRVTGIPLAEAQALRSRGDDYRQYQRTTSAFIPWPPKS